MPRYIIRRLRLAHCKKGPDRCAQCREMNVEKICLLAIAPPQPGELQFTRIQNQPCLSVKSVSRNLG